MLVCMHSNKKFIIFIIIVIISLSSLSGCVFDQLFGTSFTLTSWEIYDEEGFTGLLTSFSCSGIVTVKTMKSNTVIDSEMFLNGDHQEVLYLDSYRRTLIPGEYQLVVYDVNDNQISEESFSFTGSDISILSCSQKWWQQEVWRTDCSLIGLNMTVSNNGDVPVYPHAVEVNAGTRTYSALILPNVILPDETGFLDCFINIEDAPDDGSFEITIKDSIDNILSIDSFPIIVEKNVETRNFSWSYNNRNPTIRMPYPDFLFDYYSNIERFAHDDYSVYVFDSYDDDYLDLLVDRLLSEYDATTDVDKINYAASFVQNFKYELDDETNSSFEYARFPVETLFNGNGKGDCEDKAILMSSIIDIMGYDVALFRFSNHMATGVKLDEGPASYDPYIDDYYFLETTTKRHLVGYVPNDYSSTYGVTVYPISSRPLLLHNWKDGLVSIFTNTQLGDFVKATVFVENFGKDTAEEIKIKAGFYAGGLKLNIQTETISSLGPGMKTKKILVAYTPSGFTTTFKTQLYLDDELVDEHESKSSFS